MLKLFPVPSLFGATPLAKQRAVPDVPDAERVAGAQQPPTPPAISRPGFTKTNKTIDRQKKTR